MIVLYLGFERPSPGPLAAAHAQVRSLSTLVGCGQCHHDEGLEAGCLSCHGEIRSQLAGGNGYHRYLATQGKEQCHLCHSEHLGSDFQLVSQLSWEGDPDTFDHPHVDFKLAGPHEALKCEACHRLESGGRFVFPGPPKIERATTFLGLTQDCRGCHDDVHAGGFSGDCLSCHTQEAWRPAPGFDHSKFFALAGKHATAACHQCHPVPTSVPDPSSPATGPDPGAGLAFRTARGTTCAECHASPHRAPLGDDCQRCHQPWEAGWSEGSRLTTAGIHALTGFRLNPPHASVACDQCHPAHLAFNDKYPDPSLPGYLRQEQSCQGCHEDVHRGQFAGRYSSCLDCHAGLGFAPPLFGIAQHAARFPLRGAHAAVPCWDCHLLDNTSQVRQFASVSGECQSCHRDPHGRQFETATGEADCGRCHSDEWPTFAIRPFDHLARTGYALTGAHAEAQCHQCHRAETGAAQPILRYRGTSSACASCHLDIHRGQFRDQDDGRCDRCHRSTTEWSGLQFDHQRQSSFSLAGVHAKVDCQDCHPRIRLTDGTTLMHFKPLGKECGDCHAVVPR
jgi:hypothetical protein